MKEKSMTKIDIIIRDFFKLNLLRKVLTLVFILVFDFVVGKFFFYESENYTIMYIVKLFLLILIIFILSVIYYIIEERNTLLNESFESTKENNRKLNDQVEQLKAMYDKEWERLDALKKTHYDLMIKNNLLTSFISREENKENFQKFIEDLEDINHNTNLSLKEE